jgi:hypothetical protein
VQDVSTRSLDDPVKATGMTAVSAFSASRCGSEKAGK